MAISKIKPYAIGAVVRVKKSPYDAARPGMLLAVVRVRPDLYRPNGHLYYFKDSSPLWHWEVEADPVAALESVLGEVAGNNPSRWSEIVEEPYG